MKYRPLDIFMVVYMLVAALAAGGMGLMGRWPAGASVFAVVSCMALATLFWLEARLSPPLQPKELDRGVDDRFHTLDPPKS